jgi:SAM-dependent methyltransferase
VSVSEDIWRSRLPSEMAFWESWMASNGLIWPETYKDALDPKRPLQEYLKALIHHGPFIDILDVGAGPLTVIGRVWDFHVINTTAIDPLADEYTKLLARHNVVAPVPTQLCAGERLLEKFKPNTFDLAHAQNSLDHSFDPVLIIHNMLDVVKPGGAVFLNHAVREADTQHHEGLHRWNFYQDTYGDFCIEGPETLENISQRFKDVADITVNVPGWIQVVMVKR